MDIRVQGLRGVGVIDDIDVRITHLDSQSYLASGKSVKAIFEDHHIKPKRQRYEEAVRALGHTFVSFVASTDGALCEGAKICNVKNDMYREQIGVCSYVVRIYK